MSEEEAKASNVVRLIVNNPRKAASMEREYVHVREALPVVPAEPGSFLITYFEDEDAFGRSPIVARLIGPERARPVTHHCQVKGAPNAVIGPDGPGYRNRWMVRQRV
jgi:hypothetical protein